MIFIRHGRAIIDPKTSSREWPLDPAYLAEIAALKELVPDLPVVCSDMRRAVETAHILGAATIDPRLAEVDRVWSEGFDELVRRYFQGEALDRWEPVAQARARFAAAVKDHGPAIFVTHGTVLTIYLVSIAPDIDAMTFWSGLSTPDAWKLDGTRVTRLSAGSG